MAFGLATTGIPAAKINTWATPSARSTSLRRNNAARCVGAAVGAACKSKLGLKSRRSSSKVSSLSTRSLSDASTMLSDDDISSSRSSTKSSSDGILSPTSLPSTPGQLEGSCASSCSSSCDGTLPGSIWAGEECQQPRSARTRGSKGRVRSPDHSTSIAFELAKAARFSCLAVREAYAAADKDQDGVLTVSDMEIVFQYFGMSSSDAKKFFNLIGEDCSDRLHWREIIAVLLPVFEKFAHPRDYIDLSIHFHEELMKSSFD